MLGPHGDLFQESMLIVNQSDILTVCEITDIGSLLRVVRSTCMLTKEYWPRGEYKVMVMIAPSMNNRVS